MTPACYGTDPRFVSPERRRELLAERFKPWPLGPALEQPRPLADPDRWWEGRPATTCLARGHVSNSRFASNSTEAVIPRTNRSAQRKAHSR